ncbi:MAG: Fe-S cluster assembly protein SufB [Candidatus Woesearchaeota archaeon]
MTENLLFEPSRDLYETPDKVVNRYVSQGGFTEELVRKISSDKNEPQWMLDKRLKALEHYNNTPLPKWGPSLEKLDLDNIVYYSDPDAQESTSWDDVPEDIKRTFEKLGIPEAEREALSGVGAQYDSGVVYHNLKKEWEDKGVVFENMDVAVHKYPELVKKYFMTSCIPITDHKFVMLHAAVWSGGTFIYVPPGVTVDIPLQAYFRMNQESGGQFEHTLIIADKGAHIQYIEGCSAPRYEKSALHAGCVELHVLEDAYIKYSSIENWSKNTFNLNTKRAMVHKNGKVEWINGNLGSGVTMLYPASVLIGEGARSESLGIAFAGPDQFQDTGSKVIHMAKNTSSQITAKSISTGGGIASYRGLVKINPSASGSKVGVECDALMVGDTSQSLTYPQMENLCEDSHIAHEARVGKIGDEQLMYLMSRGLSEEEAMELIVGGFINPIIKELPLEYAAELNKLIQLEMEGSLG